MNRQIKSSAIRLVSLFLVLTIVATFGFAAPPKTAAATKKAQPATSNNFAAIDDIMNEAVAAGTIPGGVVLIGHDGKVAYRKAYGSRSLEPTREPMTVDTIFDMASVTKCVATATSMMKLIEEGKVRLGDPVSAYLPEFAKNGKGNITVRNLLTHFSGLREDLDLKAPWEGRDTAFRMVMDEKPVFPSGSRFLYSDINFETLGFIVEKVSGMSLNDYAVKNIYEPLGMKETRFNPPSSWLPRIAPTEYDEHNHMLRGIVHDPTARRMGGIAGHAGLFSTADDLAKYAQDMLTGYKVLNSLSVEKMTTPQQPPVATGVRGLGWDIDSPFATNRGELLPVGSFGHTGFTGTSIWMDPVTNTYIIILTNAVHPHVGKSVVSLRSRVATATVKALNLQIKDNQKLRMASITGYNETAAAARRVNFRNGEVKTGLDVLEARNFDTFRADSGKVKVGLVTNHTGVDAQGKRTIDVLANAPNVQLVAIFSPEHGVAGALDTTDIGNTKDAATGVPVYSVYGDSDAKRRPTADVMSSLDAVVYDIQDIGVRYYTYETTMGYFLEAAAKAGKQIIVLDRPNPVTGAFVQGPVADLGKESFVSYGQIPLRHGMTVGELAKMYNTERKINAKLTVVPMEGWIRGDWYDSTGMLWINQSPNMRSLTEATLYPGVGVIEGTNVSVGRGTDTPFEVVGAPWVKPLELSKYLNARGISGV
ncbi:MAG TPA: exo-beta-N-acetylmuramidase NamZ domain-containing protein, partial [Terriglobales bacterium]|nr:exo-beta-N-acetylmuramidase NamZ domain-containing protein [Terriglobales bacterium]